MDHEKLKCVALPVASFWKEVSMQYAKILFENLREQMNKGVNAPSQAQEGESSTELSPAPSQGHFEAPKAE